MKVVKLGEISIGAGSYGLSAPAVDYSNHLPAYLRITDIRDDGTLNLSNRRSVNDPKAINYYLKPNDIVFARTGASAGRNYFYDSRDGSFVYAGFLIKFSIDPAKVNPRYVKYFCLSKAYHEWINSINTGSTRGNINAKTYATMPIPLPDRRTQDVVVAFGDMISDKIRVNAQINDYLLQYAIMAYERALRTNCSKVRFRDLIELEDSKRQPLNKSDRENRKGKYPYYGATSIMDYIDDYLFDGIRVLLGEDGTVVTDDGKPVLQYVWGKYWVNNHAHVLKSSSEYPLEGIYLALLQTPIEHIVTGAVQQKISQKNLNTLVLRIPDAEDIKALVPFFDKYRANCNESSKLMQLRDTLLPKLMSGEIDVSKVDTTQLNNHLFES